MMLSYQLQVFTLKFQVVNADAWLPFSEEQEMTFFQVSLSLSAVMFHIARCVFSKKLKKKTNKIEVGQSRNTPPTHINPKQNGNS